MGLLEKLGLRDDPSAKLSEWLGGRLARLASETKSGEVETMQPLLSEIDERIAGFVRDHGAPALESAIDQWVDRTGLADVIAATRVFRFRQEMRETLRKPLEEVTGHGEMRDLELESALERTGVLHAHLLYQDLPRIFPRTMPDGIFSGSVACSCRPP